ncbi:MAG: hypothetical protein V4662_22595 [Verrucomicrobiota bacterium]
MILPPFPELPADSPLRDMQQRLLSLRQALEQACQDLDDQIAALGSEPAISPPAAVRGPTKPQPTQAHLDAAAEFTRRLFEADPAPVALAPERVTFEEKLVVEALAAPAAQIIEATSTGGLDPELERATLEELNNALSAAFEQISKNRIW